MRRPPRFIRSHSLRLRLSRQVRGARIHGHRRVRRRRMARFTAGLGSEWDSRRRRKGIRLRTSGNRWTGVRHTVVSSTVCRDG